MMNDKMKSTKEKEVIPAASSGQAKISEEFITIPTYKMGKPEQMLCSWIIKPIYN